MADPLLTKMGVAVAIRRMAAQLNGCDDPQAALEWAVNVGWLARSANARDELVLTREGEAAVYTFWKAYSEARDVAMNGNGHG